MEAILCEVCYRPGPDLICSRRCQGLVKVKASLKQAEARRCILEEVTKLDKDGSMCPGRLSKTVLDAMGIGLKEERDALSVLREMLFALRAEGHLRFFQKNVLVSKGKGPWEMRGSFRVKRRA